MPDAPLTIWLRQSRVGWHQSLLEPPEPDAIEYIRKDAADAMLTHAVNQHPLPHLRTVLREALEALEDNDVPGAEQILRTCLSQL